MPYTGKTVYDLRMDKAIKWAQEIANGSATYDLSKPYAGYATYQGSTDIVGDPETYVCASYIWYALTIGGFDVGPAVAAVGSNNSRYINKQLLDNGWQYQDFTADFTKDNVQRGDIVVRMGEHMGIVIDKITTLEAHRHYEDDPARDISTGSISSYWDGVFRYPGVSGEPLPPSGAEPFDIYYDVNSSGIDKLSQASLEKNAKAVYDILYSYAGVSLPTVCAILGSWYLESTWNPGAQNIYERDNHMPNTYGIGLAQWSNERHGKLITYLKSMNYDNWYDTGAGQVLFFLREITPGDRYAFSNGWYGSNETKEKVGLQYCFYQPWDALKCSTWTIEQAVYYWDSWYEYGGTLPEERALKVIGYAWRAYDILKDYVPADITVQPIPPKEKKGMPVWMMAMRAKPQIKIVWR